MFDPTTLKPVPASTPALMQNPVEPKVEAKPKGALSQSNVQPAIQPVIPPTVQPTVQQALVQMPIEQPKVVEAPKSKSWFTENVAEPLEEVSSKAGGFIGEKTMDWAIDPLSRSLAGTTASTNPEGWGGVMDGFFSNPNVQRALLGAAVGVVAGKQGKGDTFLLGLEGAVRGFRARPDKEHALAMIDKFGEVILPEDRELYSEYVRTDNYNGIANLGAKGFAAQQEAKTVSKDKPLIHNGYISHDGGLNWKPIGTPKTTQAKPEARILTGQNLIDEYGQPVPQGATGYPISVNGQTVYRITALPKGTEAGGSSYSRGSKAPTKVASELKQINDLEARLKAIAANPVLSDVTGSFEGAKGKDSAYHYWDQDEVDLINSIENASGQAELMGKQKIGAVGSVTEREWPKLATAIANLDRTSGEEAFQQEIQGYLDKLSIMKSEYQKDVKTLGPNTKDKDIAVGSLFYTPSGVLMFKEGHNQYKRM